MNVPRDTAIIPSQLSRGAAGALLAILTLAGCAAPGDDSSVAEHSSWSVRHDGVGPVQFGMTLAGANTVLHDSLTVNTVPGSSCSYVHPEAFPPGVSLMLLGDTVARVDVDSAGTVTAQGAGVGDAEARIYQLYPEVRSEPHKYISPAGHYLIVDLEGDSTYRLLFETDGQRVTTYRAGLREAVDLVERCG